MIPVAEALSKTTAGSPPNVEVLTEEDSCADEGAARTMAVAPLGQPRALRDWAAGHERTAGGPVVEVGEAVESSPWQLLAVPGGPGVALGPVPAEGHAEAVALRDEPVRRGRRRCGGDRLRVVGGRFTRRRAAARDGGDHRGGDQGERRRWPSCRARMPVSPMPINSPGDGRGAPDGRDAGAPAAGRRSGRRRCRRRPSRSRRPRGG